MLLRTWSPPLSAFALLLAGRAMQAQDAEPRGNVTQDHFEQDGTAFLLKSTWRF